MARVFGPEHRRIPQAQAREKRRHLPSRKDGGGNLRRQESERLDPFGRLPDRRPGRRRRHRRRPRHRISREERPARQRRRAGRRRFPDPGPGHLRRGGYRAGAGPRDRRGPARGALGRSRAAGAARGPGHGRHRRSLPRNAVFLDESARRFHKIRGLCELLRSRRLPRRSRGGESRSPVITGRERCGRSRAWAGRRSSCRLEIIKAGAASRRPGSRTRASIWPKSRTYQRDRAGWGLPRIFISSAVNEIPAPPV